jgi:glucose-1-phosphate thymidylyltransferase
MKGLILSGGAGTRLRPITHTSAKQLVPIANKPILFYGIESMAATGISEIGIVVGDTRAEIMAAVGDGSRFGVHVTYIPQEAPLGLAHCVHIARDFLGDDDFVMYLGDNMLEQGLGQFVERFNAERDGSLWSNAPAVAQILLKEVPNPTAFGVAAVPSNRARAASSRSPTPSNGSLIKVSACATRCYAVGGSTRARRIHCSSATAWSSTRSTRRWGATSMSTRSSRAASSSRVGRRS